MCPSSTYTMMFVHKLVEAETHYPLMESLSDENDLLCSTVLTRRNDENSDALKQSIVI